MSIYGNSNDPNQQYAASLQALQSSDAVMRNDISNRQQRQVAAQDPDSSAAQGPQQATGDMQFPASSPTGGAGAPITTVPTGTVATTPAQVQQPGMQYGGAPDSTNAELQRLANLRVQGPANVASATDMARNSPTGQAERFRQLQMLNGSDGNIHGTDIPASTVSPVDSGIPPAPTTLEQYNATRPANIPTAGKSMTGQSVADRNNNPGNLKFANQPGATPGPKLPDGTQFAVFQTPDAGAQAAQNQLQLEMSRGNNTVAGIINKWSPAGAQGNSAASTQNYIATVSKALGVAPNAPLTPAQIPQMAAAMYKQEGGSYGGGQPAAAPQGQAPQPAQPTADQGPTFVGPGGPFQMPGVFTDQTIAGVKQQAMMAAQQLQLAKMRFQANPQDPATGQAYQAAQQAATQAGQGYYDSQIYQVTQAAQGGNMNAFKTLFQEYTSKIGTPIQLVPAGNGTYAMRTQSGQVIATGSPHDLAGTMGFALNRSAQQLSMQVQQEKAMAMAKQAPELAKAYYQGNVELLKQMGVNSSQEFQKAIELNKIQVGTSNDGTVYIINPTTKQATKLGGPQTGKFDGSGTSVAIW
jgi:hypothetical protein